MGPALALVELSSIARGHRVADAMLKRAPVRLMRADAVSPGKFLVLVEGDVAAVDESFRVGADVAGDRAVDKLFLPHPHDVAVARAGGRGRTPRAASNRWASSRPPRWRRRCSPPTRPRRRPRCASREMQLARGIGGKAFFTVTGALGEVEAAVDAAIGVLDAALVHTTEIIPAPHADLVAKLR